MTGEQDRTHRVRRKDVGTWKQHFLQRVCNEFLTLFERDIYLPRGPTQGCIHQVHDHLCR